MNRLRRTVAEVEAGIMTDPESPGELDDYDLVSLYGIKRVLADGGEDVDFSALEAEIRARASRRFENIMLGGMDHE